MSCQDLIVITSYFNPLHYQTRLANYKLFRENLKKQEIPCITVECVLCDSLPELDPDPDVITVRAKDSIWQKERLLNIALDNIPGKYTKIAWLDCDILFPDNLWAEKASVLLDKCTLIQLFSWVVFLPRDGLDFPLPKKSTKSFITVDYEKPAHTLQTSKFTHHGHTGYAWAARRELITRHKLYDAAIIGNGDHFMAHAMLGDWSSVCLTRSAPTKKFLDHYYNWAVPFYLEVNKNTSFLRTNVYHLWHGEIENRRYVQRNQGLARFKFDPSTDLRLSPDDTWEWASDKPDLHDWVSNHFKLRLEDG